MLNISESPIEEEEEEGGTYYYGNGSKTKMGQKVVFREKRERLPSLLDKCPSFVCIQHFDVWPTHMYQQKIEGSIYRKGKK